VVESLINQLMETIAL